jgi:hypothetical protein
VLANCRHTFASLLIAQGLDIVFISRQLGHANPATTLRIYAHLFDRVNHEARMRETLSATFGELLPTGRAEHSVQAADEAAIERGVPTRARAHALN